MRQFIRKNIWAVAPVVFVLVALVLLGSPLSSSKVQETPAEDDNLIVVGVSQVGSESVWRSAHTQSIQDAFTRENGYMLIFDNARQKQANQIKACLLYTSRSFFALSTRLQVIYSTNVFCIFWLKIALK